ncbi:oxygen-independent coproporphyrinogen III oxidase [Thermosipho africanus Ob7]|uniref:elongator complex protein 3 n=1 Tax=Thermosipho africanus TaxID=2421 RepID=UPI000E0C7440|nr:radical SAM protein [Thermosipho africanus]RDI91685.1 oxygen-independent coproporphyrinogen III oxidase [Thermosipho africanus Ob7]
MILSIFLPNFGCKSRCIFCNQYTMTGEKMPTKKELINTLSFFLDKSPEEIAFYGGTFTAIPLEKQKELIALVRKFYPDTPIRISTRPDELDYENLKFLKQNNVKTVEIGIQSMFDNVLSAANRGHSRKDNLNAVNLLKKFGFEISAHLMIGLLNDTIKKDLLSIQELLNLGVKMFRIHPTIIFKNTELEKLYLEGKYNPLTLDEAVNIASEMLLLIYQYEAKVIRLGYFVPENQKNQIVAGPYHPSFGDMTKSKAMNKIITRLNIKKVKYPKKFESWFNSYDNKQLEIEKYLSESNEIFFDNLSLKEASKRSFRRELLD